GHAGRRSCPHRAVSPASRRPGRDRADERSAGEPVELPGNSGRPRGDGAVASRGSACFIVAPGRRVASRIFARRGPDEPDPPLGARPGGATTGPLAAGEQTRPAPGRARTPSHDRRPCVLHHDRVAQSAVRWGRSPPATAGVDRVRIYLVTPRNPPSFWTY